MENILSDTCNQSSRQVPYCMFHCCDMDLEYMDSYWLQVNKTRDYCDSDQLLKVFWPAQQKLKTESSGTERAFFGISKYPNFRDLLTGVWINLTFLLEFLEFPLLFYSHQLESSARYDWMESAAPDSFQGQYFHIWEKVSVSSQAKDIFILEEKGFGECK